MLDFRNFLKLDHKFTPESVKKIRLVIRLSVLKIFEKQKGGVFCHACNYYKQKNILER